MSHNLNHPVRHFLASVALVLGVTMCYLQLPVSADTYSTIKIPAIGVDTGLNYGSHANLSDMAEKILYKPVLDIEYSYDLCTPEHNTYIAGHSAPALKWQNKYPAVRVFQNLKDLKVGDTIEANRNNGQSCSYKVTDVRKFRSERIKDKSYRFPISVFNYLMDDDADGKSTLTLQTCDTEPGVIIVVKAEAV
jgi:sortase (surface protein transpeptidase)